MNKLDYPKNWKEISRAINIRAEGRCECLGECGLHNGQDLVDLYKGRCREINKTMAKFARGKIMLTVAHLCHKTKCPRRLHLKAMCQRCHLRYDLDLHIKHAKQTRLKNKIHGLVR